MSTAGEPRTFLFDRPELGTLRISGEDRLSWLNGIITCDVGSLRPGMGAWGLLLNKQGKIQGEVHVVAAESVAYMAVARKDSARIREYLERFLIMEDADLEDASDNSSWVALHGPDAAPISRTVAAAAAGAVDWTGQGGALIVCDAETKPAIVAELLRTAGVRLGTPLDWERARIAAGVPMYGVDYGEADNPHEASLDRRTVAWNKGCYLGQEVVCMQDMRGKVKRRLVSLRVEGASPSVGEVVWAGAAAAGEITSSVADQDGSTSLAMARVKSDYLAAPDFQVAGQRATILERPA